MLLPTTCAVCEARGPSPCGRCRVGLRPPPGDLPPPPGVDRCLSLLVYEGAGRELVARLKYRNRRASLGWLTSAMAGLVPVPAGLDLVTWVPTTAARRRQRGFDQAELLARGVARRLRLPSASLLTRRAGPAQTGRTASERLGGPAIALRRFRPVPAAVLLVDDVCTTGATLATTAAVLREAGAETVIAVTAARALRRH